MTLLNKLLDSIDFPRKVLRHSEGMVVERLIFLLKLPTSAVTAKIMTVWLLLLQTLQLTHL